VSSSHKSDLSFGLSNDFESHKFLNIHLPKVDALMENLDSNIRNVSCLLSSMIEDRCLSDQKMCLEMLTDEQIAPGELATNSLEELLKFTDEASYFTNYDPSRCATEDSPNPGKHGNARTSFSEPDTTGREDVGIIISSAHDAFIASEVAGNGVVWARLFSSIACSITFNIDCLYILCNASRRSPLFIYLYDVAVGSEIVTTTCPQ
jgi:hypothetical protein